MKYRPASKDIQMIECIIVMAIFISFAFLFSETHIPVGNVSGNWNLAGSPYLIEGEIEN